LLEISDAYQNTSGKVLVLCKSPQHIHKHRTPGPVDGTKAFKHYIAGKVRQNELVSAYGRKQTG